MSKQAVTIAGLVAGFGFSGHAQAKGGDNLISVPGQCTTANATGSGLLAKIQNNWQFALQVAGANAGGSWTISWYKNGLLVYVSSETFPSGWASFGLAASKLTDAGTVTFSAIGRNNNNGETCNASISVKL